MSGFVGVVNLDGSPVDPRLLARMTAALRFRGPDRQDLWVEQHVGLGHALLNTTGDDQPAECQPLTVDGETWMVGDVRLDGRSDLAAELAAAGERVEPGAGDAELALRAYRAWGQECVRHLLGDFAIAVWDAPRRRFFAARDHLGVKSFFYAVAGRTLVVSNTIDCIRLHPGVSDRLNELAVADFLLFELNQDPGTTVYADVMRLPPAHAMTWSGAEGAVRRYWSLPIDEPVFYRRQSDYVERFNELLDGAVADRLPAGRVGVFMSGGIDSPALAVSASRVYGASARPNGVRAFTTSVEGLDGGEAHFARLAADRIGIPIDVEDGARAFEREWDRSRIHTASPVRLVTSLAFDRRSYARMTAWSRVAFYGEGPDNALQYEWQPYVRYLRRSGRYLQLAGDALRHLRAHRRLPLPSIVRRLGRARQEGEDQWALAYPGWLNRDFERQLKLRERWEHFQDRPASVKHPVRPAAHYSFSGLEWEALFRGFDPEETGATLDVRHPYCDLRLLRFLLSVPAVPWCRQKHLIRRAMRADLPPEVLVRPKTGLTSDPDYEFAKRAELPPLEPAPEIDRFIDCARVPGAAGSDMMQFRTDFRARALNYWLANLERPMGRYDEENEHDVAHA